MTGYDRILGQEAAGTMIVGGEDIEFRNFSVFEVITRKSRIGRNPHKPEDTVIIPARRVVKLKPGKEMKARVLKGY